MTPRFTGFVEDARQLYCPKGHHIARRKVERIIEMGYIECGAVVRPSPIKCEELLFVFKPKQPGKVLYAVSINRQELEHIEDAQNDLFEILNYLGVAYTAPTPMKDSSL